MADSKISAYSTLTGANLAAGDLFEVVDVSDTTLAASGTNKKMTTTDVRVGVGGITVSSLSPSADTYINQQATTTNYGTATVLFIGEKFDSSASFGRVALFAFDISTLTGASVISARLKLYRDEAAPTTALSTTNRLVARRVKRAFVASEATWNIYSTGNNWATAGARGGADVETETYSVLTVRGDRDADIWSCDLTELVRDALTAGDTTLRFLLGWAAATDGQNSAQMGSQDNATSTKRPLLRIASIGI